MNLTMLSDKELFKLAAYQYSYNGHIHHEWLRRNEMFFPYKLINDQIYNEILDVFMEDSECDRLVSQQANLLRERRAKQMTENDVFI